MCFAELKYHQATTLIALVGFGRAQGEPFQWPVFSSEIQSRSIHGHGRGRSLLCTRLREEFVVHNSVLVEHNSVAQPPSLPL
jgi:hypothetical protein